MSRKLLLLLILGIAACGGGRARLELLQANSNICSQDEQGNLILRIGNAGKGQSIATTTQVEFPDRPPFMLPTRPISKQDSTEIRVPVPEGCETTPCRIVVIVDARDEVPNQGTESKKFELLCRLHPYAAKVQAPGTKSQTSSKSQGETD